jgi:hypothetical protein
MTETDLNFSMYFARVQKSIENGVELIAQLSGTEYRNELFKRKQRAKSK